MLLVHDVVARPQRQRVDAVAPLRRHPAHVLRGRPAAAAGEVGLGEHHERQLGEGEPAFERAAHDRDDTGLRRADEPVLGQRGRHVGLAELLGGALRGAGAGHDEHRRAAGRDVRAQVAEGPFDVALVGLDVLEVQAQHVLALGGELAQRPPRASLGARGVGRLGQAPVGRGPEVDRRLAAARGGHPGRLQELLAGAHQVLGAGADLLRIGQQHLGAVRDDVGEHLQLALAQRRDQRLHALRRDAVDDLVEHLHQVRVALVLLRQRGRAGLHAVGQQHLAARRRGELPHLGRQRPLVGHRERPDLADLVAPELHPQRVLGGRREHVEDATAHRELAALLDHVDPRVGHVHQPPDELGEVQLDAHLQVHRLQLAQPRRHRLDQRPHGRHHDLQRPGRVLLGVRQPAQDLQPRAHGVRARRQPFVRQRLPRREVHDRVRPDQVAQLRRQVVGLAPGRGHHQHRAVGALVGGERRGDQRPGGGRAFELERRVARGVDQRAQRLVGQDGGQQAGQRAELGHFGAPVRETRTDPCPGPIAPGRGSRCPA